MPCGRKIRSDEHQEGEAVLVGHGDIGRAEGLDDAEREAADDRAGDSPKPPMIVAAKALSAIVEPIWIETKRIGATRMPAMPPSRAE